MTLHLGFSHAHSRSAQQQQEIREAKRLLKEKIQNDWDYPPLPAFQLPVRSRVIDSEDAELRVAGFKFHTTAHYKTSTVAGGSLSTLYFHPVEWRERECSSESEAESDSPSTVHSAGSKKSIFRFEGPDSVGTQIQDWKISRKRKRQQALEEEAQWNDGLAHWLARRDAWSGAHTTAQIQVLETKDDERTTSTSGSANTTPRTSTSSTSSTSAVVSSPSTTPELRPEMAPVIGTRPAVAPADIMVPVAPALLVNHPIRRRITPEIFPEIYAKIILQSRTPSVPINLSVLIKALVQGWKDDGEWPPKQGPVEKSIGRKKSGHESSLKSSVKAVGRVLRITSGESSVGGSREKG